MKKLLFNYLAVFWWLLVINHCALSKTKENSYSLATGTADVKRLLCLNEAINSHSILFLKKHIKNDDNVLELGCGIGLMSQEISKMVGEKGKVLATDISTQQLKIANKISNNIVQNNLTFKLFSAYDLSAIEEKYDVVYMRFLLVHLKHPCEVIKEIQHVLKPGGCLLIEESTGNDTIETKPKDSRLDLVKKIDSLQEESQKTDFNIALTMDSFLRNEGFKIISKNIIHPKLDTLNKRRNFSLGMRSLEKALVTGNKISTQKLNAMIHQVENMEEDNNVKLYFYKIGQIAAKKVT